MARTLCALIVYKIRKHQIILIDFLLLRSLQRCIKQDSPSVYGLFYIQICVTDTDTMRYYLYCIAPDYIQSVHKELEKTLKSNPHLEYEMDVAN